MNDRVKKICINFISYALCISVSLLTGFWYAGYTAKRGCNKDIAELEDRVAQLTATVRGLEETERKLRSTNNGIAETNRAFSEELLKLDFNLRRAEQLNKSAVSELGGLGKSIEGADAVSRRFAEYLQQLEQIYQSDGNGDEGL